MVNHSGLECKLENRARPCLNNTDFAIFILGHSPYLTSPYKPGCTFVFDENIPQTFLPPMTASVQRPPNLCYPVSFPTSIAGTPECISPRAGSLLAYLHGGHLVPRMSVSDDNIFNFKM